jgi:hypothetical protein
VPLLQPERADVEVERLLCILGDDGEVIHADDHGNPFRRSGPKLPPIERYALDAAAEAHARLESRAQRRCIPRHRRLQLGRKLGRWK